MKIFIHWFNKLLNILIQNNMMVMNDKEYIETYQSFYMKSKL